MNIAYAKIGKSIKFRTKMYSPTGGDCEPAAFARAIANNNPKSKLFIVGRSDFKELSAAERQELFPHNNVIDVWESFTGPWFEESKYDSGSKKYHSDMPYHPLNFIDKNKIKIDFSVMLVGQLGSSVIPNKVKRIDGQGLVDQMQMSVGYAAPVAIWLNENRAPWAEIVNDPRYTVAQSRDIFVNPTKSLGQYDVAYERRHIRNYDDQTRVTTRVKSIYAGMEVGFLYGKQPLRASTSPRNVQIMMILNEGHSSPYQLPGVFNSRYDELRRWVLNQFTDVEIYGEWKHPDAKKDVRFKGTAHLDELQQKLRDVRYSLCIPIAKGWVTGKFLELIYAGVIPFFHSAYDDQRHVPLPDFLRVRSPFEFKERVEELDKDPKKYKALLRETQHALLKPEYYDGSFLSKTVIDHMTGQAIERPAKAVVKVEPAPIKFSDKVEPVKGTQGSLF